jgi:ankyrin repeat protein
MRYLTRGMAIDREGRNELINAVIDRDVSLVKQLLLSGIATTFADREGWTALHFAAQNNDPEIADLLLTYGALLESRDRFGNTPLFRAVFSYRGGADCISVLLEAGANPDLMNDHGVSPRHLATTIANYDTRKFFR